MDERPLKERLSSRRFLLALVASVLVVVGKKLGIDLDEQQLLALFGISAAYSLKDVGTK